MCLIDLGGKHVQIGLASRAQVFGLFGLVGACILTSFGLASVWILKLFSELLFSIEASIISQ
jgi:hypothetical protein